MRKSRSLARTVGTREPKKRVLIVTEDSKSSLNYFSDWRSALRLTAVDIKHRNPTPLEVVGFAEEVYLHETKANRYENVFVVIDKDEHPDYDAAVQKVALLNKKHSAVFYAITSVPCFEFWVLLHFKYSTAPYSRSGKKSPADCLIGELCKLIPFTYDKGISNLYSKLLPLVDTAVVNAQRSEIAARSANTDNPSTKIHELISFLRSL